MSGSFQLRWHLLLCCLSWCFIGCNPVSPEKAELDDLRSRVSRIQPEVEKIRGLYFVRPVHVAAITREAYTNNVAQNISGSLTDVEDGALAKEYAQMGLLSETDTPLTTILSDFYSSFPAAFYRTGTDSLYLIPNTERNELQLDGIIAHELTHALQDQNFPMWPTIFPEYSHYNSDAETARRALIEGDALFTEVTYAYSAYYAGHPIAPYDSAREVVNDYRTDLLIGSYQADTPVFLDIKSVAPYFLGASYVAELYHLSDNWDRINGSYTISSVPRSTASVNYGKPVPVVYFNFYDIHRLLVAEPGTIEFADDDNAGFGLLLGLFYHDQPEGIGRSLEWCGDRYTFVKRSGQPYGTLVWALAFTTPQGARTMFHHFFRKIAGRQLGGQTTEVDSVADSTGIAISYTFTSSVVSTTLQLADNQLWWLENTGSLTGQVLDILQHQQTISAVAKTSTAPAVPLTLSSEVKNETVSRLLEYLMCSGKAAQR